MGYSTDFAGVFLLDKPLTKEHEEVLIAVAEERFEGPDDEDAPQPTAGSCQWVPAGSADGIEWDYGEKFYNYVEWLEYLIKRFLKPWGYVLNGDVEWQGEDREDRGMIRVTNNKVKTLKGTVVYKED